MNSRDELPVEFQTKSNDILNILDSYRNDDYCSNLLTIFCASHPQTMGFNEILRRLKKTDIESNPSPYALQKHLGHLTEHRVIRKQVNNASKLKLAPSIYSLTPEFVELGKELFATNRRLDIKHLKEELKTRTVAEVTHEVTFILLRDAIDSVRDSLLLNPRVRDFKRALKSLLINVALDEYCKLVRASGKVDEALSVLMEVDKKLSDYDSFNNTIN